MTNAIAVAEPHTDEWQIYRTRGIGSSDAAAALGLSKYATPLDIYLKKTGQVPEFAGNELTDYGKVIEPAILQLWEKRTEQKAVAYPCPMYQSQEHPFMLATPDAQLNDHQGVEIKSLTWRLEQLLPSEENQELTENTPDYIIQAHHQMAVTGWDTIFFAVLIERKVRNYQVQRNDDLIEALVTAETELWERIENRDPPPPNYEHSHTPELIRDMHDHVLDEFRIELSEEAAEAWNRRREILKQKRELEKEEKALKAQVLMEIGEHYAGVLPGGEKMVRRKLIKKDEYLVKATEYVDAREVKADGGLMFVEADAATISDRYQMADNILRERGFKRQAKSEWGSAYYLRRKDQVRFRISDHAPNKATHGWMEEVHCNSIRIDRKAVDVVQEIKDVLNQE